MQQKKNGNYEWVLHAALRVIILNQLGLRQVNAGTPPTGANGEASFRQLPLTTPALCPRPHNSRLRLLWGRTLGRHGTGQGAHARPDRQTAMIWTIQYNQPVSGRPGVFRVPDWVFGSCGGVKNVFKSTGAKRRRNFF